MEIQQVLTKNGATKVSTDFDYNGLPVCLTFGIIYKGNMMAFSLPSKHEGVLKVMKNNSKVPKRLLTEEQSLRVSWRIILTWVKAQMALVECEIADLQEVFLPYAITKNGNTLYKEIESTNILKIE